jgi:hypothetical protein
MVYIDINKQAYIRDAAELLIEGKADEAVALIEQNHANGNSTIVERFIKALSLDAIGHKYDARKELMNILAVDNSHPAAIEKLMEFCDDDHQSLGIYYKNRLNEIMGFIRHAKEFWMIPEEDVSHGEKAKPEKKSRSTTDRKPLIESINKMLGSEAERVWPFETKTLAELFIKQGHLRRGLAVYSRLLGEAEDNDEIVSRVNELLNSVPVNGSED